MDIGECFKLSDTENEGFLFICFSKFSFDHSLNIFAIEKEAFIVVFH